MAEAKEYDDDALVQEYGSADEEPEDPYSAAGYLQVVGRKGDSGVGDAAGSEAAATAASEIDGVVDMDLKPSAAFQKWTGGMAGDEIDSTVQRDKFESPIQKYERLKREMTDFSAELAGLKKLAESHSEEPTKDVISKVNDEINKLWLNVEEFSKNPTLASLFASAESSAGKDSTLTVDSSFLFKKLKELEASSSIAGGGGSGTDGEAGGVTFTLFQGASSAERKSVRMEELESRIAYLEGLIVGSVGAEATAVSKDTSTGTKEYERPGAYDTSGSMIGTRDTQKGMLSNVELLWQRLELLTDETRLSSLQKRAELLKKGLEDISFETKELVEDQITKAKEKKIEDMFDMLQRWDSMAVQDSLPKVVRRLRALKVVHTESAEVVTKVNDLATQQALIKDTLKESQNILKDVSQSLADNAQVMAANLESIESRIAALQSKYR